MEESDSEDEFEFEFESEFGSGWESSLDLMSAPAASSANTT
jgi:hypothetical protein